MAWLLKYRIRMVLVVAPMDVNSHYFQLPMLFFYIYLTLLLLNLSISGPSYFDMSTNVLSYCTFCLGSVIYTSKATVEYPLFLTFFKKYAISIAFYVIIDRSQYGECESMSTLYLIYIFLI